MRGLGLLTASRWRALTGSASAAAVALGLLACLCTLLAVVGPRAAAQLRTSAFRQFIAAAPAADKVVVGSVDDSTLSVGEQRGLNAKRIQLAKNALRHNLSALPLVAAAADWSSLTTPLLDVSDNAAAVQAPLPPRLELTYRDALSRNARVVAGKLPAGNPGNGSTVTLQAAVTGPTAHRFGFTVGSRVQLPDTGIALLITAIIKPRDPAALFWSVDSTFAKPEFNQISPTSGYWLGGVFLAPSAVAALQTRININDTLLTWTFPLALGHLTAAQAAQLQPTLAGKITTAGRLTSGKAIPISVTISSDVGMLIAEFEADAASVGSILDLLAVSLAVLAAAVVLLAARLLAEQRREEFAILRARGASRLQLGISALGVSAITAVPGAAVGAVIAVALTPAAPVPLSWWLAGLELLAALAGPALITVRTHRGYATAARPDQPAGRLSAARRLVVEAGLVLGAAGGLIVLRDQGNGAGDVYPSAAPVLIAIGVAVVVLRVYPLLVRGLLRLTGRRAGATTFLGLARAARVSASATLPAFAMVLALALVSFAGMVRSAVTHGEVLASWQQAGADAVITGPGPVSPTLQRAVAAVPGVAHAVPVSVTVGWIAKPAEFTVLVTDPAQYAALVAATPLPQPGPGFAAGAAAGGPAGPIPALASPALAAQLGHGPVTVNINGQLVPVRVTGQAATLSALPGIGSGSGYLVVDRRVVTSNTAGAPDTMLVVGAAMDQSALRAAVARYDAGASIVFRSRLLTGLEAAPLSHDAYLTFAVGAAAAACCCLLVLLLSLLLSARARELSIARMTTMGLSAAQGRWLGLIELLPQLLAVLVGGLVSAVALVPLIGPALSLAVFTGSSGSVAVRIEPAWLAATASGLLVLAVVTLTGQELLTDRNAARSLRIGE